ncbi:hypothetical protein C2E23DRAFT_804237 [Lenzites betulinus]|nr:hypothetical protein C2E23DRAFT_804237 [Lenzites betulinus]
MDSQLTLVDANELPDRQAYIELVFDRDSLTNAKLLVKGGSRTVYSIKTTGRSMSRTEIYKPQSTERAEQTGGVPGELVLAAVIDRNEVLPDTISFTGLQKMKTRKWLQDNVFTVTHPDTGEVRYVWKPTSVRELVLYAEENPFVPVAWYRTAKRTSPVAAAGDVIEPPSLSIQPEEISHGRQVD